MEGAHPEYSGELSSHAAEQASKAIDRVSKMTRPAVERAAASAHSAVDSIANATCQVADTLGRKSQQLIDAEARMVGSTRGYIAANPITALAIALAAGVLISRMLAPPMR